MEHYNMTLWNRWLGRQGVIELTKEQLVKHNDKAVFRSVRVEHPTLTKYNRNANQLNMYLY